MEKLLAAGIARIDRSHRLHHVVVTIHFVDEGDSRLGIFVGTGDDAVPDVRGVDHSRTRWFFNRAIGEISVDERLLVGERYSRTIGTAVDNILTVAHWIVNRICPRLAVKLELEPLVIINGFQKLI